MGVLLESPNVEANVALWAVKNLSFVGKWFIAQSSSIEAKPKENKSDDNSEDKDEDKDKDRDQDQEEEGEGVIRHASLVVLPALM